MSNTFKKFCATLLTVILIISVSVPFFAFAENEGISTEISPSITATFTDTNGDECDGGELEVGEYNVNLVLSGMNNFSIFQIDAEYTDDITINSVSTIVDNDSSLRLGSDINEDNSFIYIIATDNDEYSVIANPQTMITMNVTVNTAGDFADYFIVHKDPQLTFVEASYADGFDKAYVDISNDADDNAVNTLTIDMSPVLGANTYTVKGQILIATVTDCSATSKGVNGITVSVNGTDVSDVTKYDETLDENGYYTLSGLTEGTYTLTIAGPTTIDRGVRDSVTLIVSSDKAVDGVINVDAVPIVICDYNHDSYINNADTGLYFTAYAEYNPYMDINAEGHCNNADFGLYLAFVGKTITYTDLTL